MTREEAIADLQNALDTGSQKVEHEETLEMAISVLSANREKGEWIRHKSKVANTEDSRECSNCHVWLNWDMPRNSFCPNCGADMRGE